MSQGKRDSLILSFIGQGDTVMQITDFHKTLVDAKSSCTFTLMAEGDKIENHIV